MPIGRPPIPYSQGQLDGLCGIYAAINAIRLALGSSATRLAFEDWRDLFYMLLLTADQAIGAVQATVCGIDTKPFRKVLGAAVRHMADEHEIQLTIKPVLQRGERRDFSDVLPGLASILHQPHHALIVSFEGHLDHWTVIRRVGERSLELFDSSEFSRVSIANCRMSYQPKRPKGVEHIIHPTALFQVTAMPTV